LAGGKHYSDDETKDWLKKMKSPRLVRVDLDIRVVELAAKTDHRALMKWATDCAERVLPYFERSRPGDDRPRMAIEAGREWARTGAFRIADVRRLALAAHAAAREVEGDAAARSAARAAGQAAATAHVPGHAIAAAAYAATATRDGVAPADADAAALEESEWQYRHLLELQ